MSKIAEYLNEHILGEITADKTVRERFARDGSILSITPELVLFPRVTNDIRKAARFSWQLAEKGHVLPLTARGYGSDTTGAAIGKGLIINTTAHLDTIIHIALKDKEKFVHVQPGVNFKTLNDTLNWHGLYVPATPDTAAYSTVGGAVANNTSGQLAGVNGQIVDYVSRLEVVLANGDLIETTRLSRKDVSKKIGLQTFEGEIYRKLDGIIEDSQEAIAKIASYPTDNAGYGRIAQVKQKDGSFDLTPLFVGSQGTLGIISEIVLRTDFVNKEQLVIVAKLDSAEQTRDAVDSLRGLEPASIETFDGELFMAAEKRGKKYPFFADTDTHGSVLYVQFGDFSEGARNRKLKKAIKILSKFNASVITSLDRSIEEIQAIREVGSTIYATETDGTAHPPLIDGASIPSERHEEFASAVKELASKHHVELPLHTRVLDGVVSTRPGLHLGKLSDKQKVFKLLVEYAGLVDEFGGTFISQDGEGRLKANAAYTVIDEDVRRLYQDIRAVFDPFGTLNSGVKQSSELKDLVGALRNDYDSTDFAHYSPYS